MKKEVLNEYVIFTSYKKKKKKSNIISVSKKCKENIGKVVFSPKGFKKIKKNDIIIYKGDKKKEVFLFGKKYFFTKYKNIIFRLKNGK
ncbi:10kDa chaperone part of GroE chaperone system [Candidatus Vidania fulgoroideae]|nr:10kDa chaperone part of GroE chaperone system [Candidatus Vidania fulgoroideae]